jgi:hypothetical protein
MYWIYQNHPTKMITVHIDRCVHCKNGKGKQNPKGSLNGVWLANHLGLKNAYKHAEQLAKTYKYKYRLCSTCIGNEKAILKPQPLIPENLICDYEGVYKIHIYDKSKPLTISRLLCNDKQGVLYIGQSEGKEGVAKRLKGFLTNINNSKSNSHTAGFKIANRTKLKTFLKNKQLFFTCYQDSNPTTAERNELNNYIKKFGETPPLNQ